MFDQMTQYQARKKKGNTLKISGLNIEKPRASCTELGHTFLGRRQKVNAFSFEMSRSRR